jgi:hypothetical protein
MKYFERLDSNFSGLNFLVFMCVDIKQTPMKFVYQDEKHIKDNEYLQARKAKLEELKQKFKVPDECDETK